MKRYILLILISISSLDFAAQNLSDAYKYNEQSVISPSPQSFIFEKYVNQPVSEYNGIPQISIPLGEIKLKGLTIPITLSYHASGVKYMQFDGDLGAGWSINIGGYRISRTINSRSDFENTPYYYGPYFWEELLPSNKPLDIDGYLGSLYQKGKHGSYIASWDNPADGERDLFTFNTPTSNGHFHYKSHHTIEKTFEKINISKTEGKIIDTQGNMFYFGGFDRNNNKLIESAVMNYEFRPTAWLLSKLVTPFNDSITFDYRPYIQYQTRNIAANKSIIVSEAAARGYLPSNSDNPEIGSTSINSDAQIRSSNDLPDNIFLCHQMTESFYLDNIKTSNMTIVINRKDDKDPNYKNRPGSNKNSPCLIDNIQIKSKSGEILKNIYFSYKTSPETIENERLPWHHLLRLVAIQTSNSIKEEYKFLYNEPKKNIQESYYPDQWGFYKRGGGLGNVILHKELADEKILSSYTSRSHLPAASERIVKFGSMAQNLADRMFVDRKSNDNPQIFSLRTIIYPTGGYREFEYEPNRFKGITGGGMRIKTIKAYDGLKRPEIITYKYSDGIPNLNINENNFQDMSFSFSLERSQFSYSCIRTFSMNPTGNVPIHDFSVNYPEVTVERSSLNKVDTIYEGKTVMKYLIPEKYKTSPMQGAPHTERSHPLSTYRLPVSISYNDRNSTINVLEYALGYSPQLQNKEIWNKDNKLVYKEEFRYKDIDDYADIIPSHYAYPEIKVKQVVNFDGHHPNDLKYCGEKAYMGWTDYRYPYPLVGTQCRDVYNRQNAYSYIRTLYSYMFYRYRFGRLLPESKTIIQYDNNGQSPVSMTETYSYDDKYRLLKTTQTNSINNYLEKEYIYPSLGAALYDKNMLSTTIETITKHNDKEIGRIKNIYESKSILPSSIQTSTSNPNEVRTDIIFNKYDSKGNILQYTTLDGLSTIYLWSYNGQYPIAEIKGVSYSDVETVAKSVFNVTNIETLSNMAIPPEAKLKDGGLQKALPKAIVSTYTYKPLVGLISATDPTGTTVHYNLDNAARLLDVRDNDNKLISEYSYVYKQSDWSSESVDVKPTLLWTNSPHIGVNNLTISSNNTNKSYSYSWSVLNDSDKIIESGNTAEITHNFMPGKYYIDYSITDQESGYKFFNGEKFDIRALSANWGEKQTTNFPKQLFFTAGYSGGSGKVQYFWTLKNKQGTIVNSSTSNNYYVYVQEGEQTVNCQIKDLITNEIITLTPHPLNVKPAYMQLYGSWDNAPKFAEMGSIFISFNASGGGGSKNYSYEWKLFLNGEEYPILGEEGGAYAYFSKLGNYRVQCKVRDNLYNTEETFYHDIQIIKEVIGFSNVIQLSAGVSANIVLKSSSRLKFRIGDSGSYIPSNSFVVVKIRHSNGTTLFNERIQSGNLGKVITSNNIPIGTISVSIEVDAQAYMYIRCSLYMELLNPTSEKILGDNYSIYYPNPN